MPNADGAPLPCDQGDRRAYLEPLASVTAIERKTTGWIRTAERATPAAQWNRKRSDEEQSLRHAARAYDALVRRWPHAPEAAPAQQRLAELQDARGKLQKAFAEFRYLLHFYPGQAAPKEILDRLLAIANHYKDEGRENVALQMFLQIAELAPQWSKTPQALLQADCCRRQTGSGRGRRNLQRISANHPGSPEAEAAAERRAHALYRIARRFERDEAVQNRALASLSATLRDYPKHTGREKLQEELMI